MILVAFMVNVRVRSGFDDVDGWMGGWSGVGAQVSGAGGSVQQVFLLVFLMIQDVAMVISRMRWMGMLVYERIESRLRGVEVVEWE